MRKTLAALGVLVALCTASAASATTYLLNVSDAFGSGTFGKVTVTGSSTDLHFDVMFDNPFVGMQIIDTGSHYAFSGKLSGSGFGLVLPSSETGDFTLSTSSTSSLSNSPFGGFNFALNCVSCGSGASSPFGNHLTFDITGTGLGVLAASPYKSNPIYFAADVYGNGKTGTVGGGPIIAVPEPATWSMMLLGFFGAGALLRSRRRVAQAALA